jgi:hypothetical protein
MGLLIQDGYTMEGKLPDRGALHGEITFKYRPALPEAVNAYLKEINNATADKALAADLRLIAKYVVEIATVDDWPADEAGRVKMLRMVPHPDLQVLVSHVCCWSAGEWAAKEKN